MGSVLFCQGFGLMGLILKLDFKKHQDLYLIVPIGLIILAEQLIFFRHMQAAMIIHAFNLLLIIALYIYTNDRAYPILLLLPLFRLLNVAMPVFFQLILYSYSLVYALMFIPIYIIMKKGFLSYTEAGITLKGFWFYLPLAVASGLSLGWGESKVLYLGLLIPDLSIRSIIILALIMIVFVGFVEEFVFRSALQTIMEEHMGRIVGLVITSIIFGFMQSGYHLSQELLYCTFVGLVFGVLFWITRSLPVIAVAHGMTNVSLFLVVPSYPELIPSLIIISAILFLLMAFYANIFIKKRTQM